MLTELLPPDISGLIQSRFFQDNVVQTTTLSLDAPAGTMHRKVCDTFRGSMGVLRGSWGAWYESGGFVSQSDETKTVIELNSTPENSLLIEHLTDGSVHHEDTFTITVNGGGFQRANANKLLELMLEGFLINTPGGVSRLMMIRNILVQPLGLRTSPLGCPVSSLLSDNTSNLFANQYPVIDQRINKTNTVAEVILGANDRHLKFRSCVSVEIVKNNQI